VRELGTGSGEVSGPRLLGWLLPCWAGSSRVGPVRLSLFFCSVILSIFCFLISFIDFAKLLQINSNHFQKFCKIQGKVLNQQQTYFQNQSRVFNKRSWLSLMALLA
jgi:hypothetical protein